MAVPGFSGPVDIVCGILPAALSAVLLVAWTPSEGTLLQLRPLGSPPHPFCFFRVLPGDIRILIYSYFAGTRESVSLGMRGRGPEVREGTVVNVLQEGLIAS